MQCVWSPFNETYLLPLGPITALEKVQLNEGDITAFQSHINS